MSKKYRIKKGEGFPVPFTLQTKSPRIVDGKMSYSDWKNEKTVRIAYDPKNELNAFVRVQKKLGVKAPVV